MAAYFSMVFLALLCAFNVYMGVSTGSALSWSVAAFIAILAINQSIMVNRK